MWQGEGFGMTNSRAGVVISFGLLICFCSTATAQKKQQGPLQAEFVTHHKLPDGRVVTSSGSYYRSSRGQIREDSGTSGQIIDLKQHTVVSRQVVEIHSALS
jgi:hypothetical protein